MTNVSDADADSTEQAFSTSAAKRTSVSPKCSEIEKSLKTLGTNQLANLNVALKPFLVPVLLKSVCCDK